MSEPSTKDRLLDTFVYAPIGLALYARDAAPGFLRLFVARGRHEFDRHKDQVADQLNDGVETAMTVGQQAMASAPEVRRRVEDGVGQARDLVEGVVTNLRDGATQAVANGGTATAPSPPAAPAPTPDPRPAPAASQRPATPPAPERPLASSASEPPSPPPPPERPAERERPSAPSSAASPLPIPDYDELAASQVVERLEGLDLVELEAVADYERARRGRRTILGKIEQLTG